MTDGPKKLSDKETAVVQGCMLITALIVLVLGLLIGAFLTSFPTSFH